MEFFRSFQKVVGLVKTTPPATPPSPLVTGQNSQSQTNSEDIVTPEKMPEEGSFGSILWSFLSTNLGADVLRSGISLPSYMYEPLSILQRQAEMIEHSYVLNNAAKCKDSIEQLAYVCAFAVSGYSATQRYKPAFNPLLGETFEFIEKRSNTRFIAEQVSHHPPISAFHSENEAWKFWQNSSPATKFLGNSIDLITHGNSYISFHESKNQFFYTNPSTRVHNVIFGTMRIEHYGALNIRNLNGSAHALVIFSKSGYFQGTQYQVEGFIYDQYKNKCVKLSGRWDSYLSATWLVDTESVKTGEEKLLWKYVPEPIIVEAYQFRPYAASLNEFDADADTMLPPTDSRRRLDRYYLDVGDNEAASYWKHSMEDRQRLDKKLRTENWTPVWFRQLEDTENGLWVYRGDYWEQKDLKLSLSNKGKDTDGLLYPPQIRGLACDFLSYRARALPIHPVDPLFPDEDTNEDLHNTSDCSNEDDNLPISQFEDFQTNVDKNYVL